MIPEVSEQSLQRQTKNKCHHCQRGRNINAGGEYVVLAVRYLPLFPVTLSTSQKGII